MIKVINAHFVQSCERFSQAPSILGAEIAILGRSNVGKSSLINALLNNKNLAKSSSTPGKTRLVNFFNAKWRVDSAELINSQNLNQNNPRVSAHLESRPLRGAKNREQGCSSATADFLLEAESRGSPPKSEKAAAFWEHNKKELGGAGRGVQPFLRKELSENCGEGGAESRLDSIESQNLQGGLPRAINCTHNDEVKSPQDAEFAEFAVRILDFPGFGYAKVSKAEKSSWDKHLSEFLKKRDSIKLYLHLIDSRHQNLEIDNEIFAFLNRFKRGDSAILQVFTKADKLSKNELSRLKNQNKLYHSINDKNSTEILRYAILKMLYNVDF